MASVPNSCHGEVVKWSTDFRRGHTYRRIPAIGSARWVADENVTGEFVPAQVLRMCDGCGLRAMAKSMLAKVRRARPPRPHVARG